MVDLQVKNKKEAVYLKQPLCMNVVLSDIIQHLRLTVRQNRRACLHRRLQS
jgi:hypothetical protein